MSRLIGVATLGILLTACAQDPNSLGWNTGVKAEQPNYIPVPRGMTLQDRYHQSNTHRVGSYQYADLQYKGDVAVATVANYVLDRFNSERFTLKTREVPSRLHEKMLFQRGRLTVACDVQRLEHTTVLSYEVRTRVREDADAPANEEPAAAPSVKKQP